MNKKWLQQEIIQAKDQLEEILVNLNDKNKYGLNEFEFDVQHAYTHLNIAYNTREWDDEQINKFSDADYSNVKKTPKDLIFVES